MSTVQHRPPNFDARSAAVVAREHWGIDALATTLPSERDQNFQLETAAGERYVLKLAEAHEERAFLDCQNAAIAMLAAAGTRFRFPRPVASLEGPAIVEASAGDGAHLARVLEWVPGEPLALARPQSGALLREVGALAGTVDRVFAGFEHPAADRVFHWDLRRARDVIGRHRSDVAVGNDGPLVDAFLPLLEAWDRFDATLRGSVIHGDANDHNVVVWRPDRSAPAALTTVVGIVDFGDMVRSWTAGELAIACAYAMLGKRDPLAAAAHVVAGYDAEHTLEDAELAALFPLIGARLCTSLVLAAHQRGLRPENEYLSISTAPVRALLARLAEVSAAQAERMFREACGRRSPHAPIDLPPAAVPPIASAEALLERRRASIGPSLSIAYDRPLVIVRGWRQHLYDAAGQQYLDAVNNVAHVGHCHPRVTEALRRQSAILNTNTRYLHPLLEEYAERLTATLPAPLRVCYFVCSGSEANELALRLARAHTGRRDVIVLDGAYHGNTTSLIELSPYKFDGPGGEGGAPHVHVAPLPDPYRGRHRGGGEDGGRRYADEVGALAERLLGAGRAPCAFFAEALPGCGGQVVPPDGFLAGAFRHVRAAGGVCVADEVQTGLGRVGTHFWAFETQGAVPDIVTAGKPMGNGHPLGAVITTPEIAHSFANGMEYFNTFGGNPVSCAVGLAVLDAIGEDGLQANALRVGTRLLEGLRALGDRHDVVGDVRGRGLYIGVELVLDRDARSPAGALAAHVANRMRDRGILIGTDGANHNVLKIKPPMVFDAADADRLVLVLDDVLAEDAVRRR